MEQKPERLSALDEKELMNNSGAFLYEVLNQRKSRNRNYSTRAFARDLGLSAAFVSQVMSGKRNLSLPQKLKIASLLGIEFSELKLKPHKSSSSLKLSQIQHSLEHEKILKYWYHFAILSLAQINDLSADLKVISKRLGITPAEASGAIERLVNFGYLSKSGKKFIRTQTPFIIDAKKSSHALRQLHKVRLLAAENELEAFDQDRISRRHFQTLFVPTSRTKVQKAKSMITDFQKELIAYLMEDQPDEIFQLSLQLFSIENSRE